jgi:hypothetical protein
MRYVRIESRNGSSHTNLIWSVETTQTRPSLHVDRTLTRPHNAPVSIQVQCYVTAPKLFPLIDTAVTCRLIRFRWAKWGICTCLYNNNADLCCRAGRSKSLVYTGDPVRTPSGLQRTANARNTPYDRWRLRRLSDTRRIVKTSVRSNVFTRETKLCKFIQQCNEDVAPLQMNVPQRAGKIRLRCCKTSMDNKKMLSTRLSVSRSNVTRRTCSIKPRVTIGDRESDRQ